MTDTPPRELRSIEPELVRALAAAAGVSLSDARAAALVPQAEPHFALLRELDAIADPGAEPAAAFRLDEAMGLPGD